MVGCDLECLRDEMKIKNYEAQWAKTVVNRIPSQIKSHTDIVRRQRQQAHRTTRWMIDHHIQLYHRQMDPP
jgi:hypothetical protein